MIIDKIEFDPVRDQHPVEQFGFIDLKTALDSNMVPSQMPDSDSDYNGIDDPSKVLGVPRDVFEAIDAQKQFEAAASADSSKGELDE